jgi:hypothetical protein
MPECGPCCRPVESQAPVARKSCREELATTHANSSVAESLSDTTTDALAIRPSWLLIRLEAWVKPTVPSSASPSAALEPQRLLAELGEPASGARAKSATRLRPVLY